jgi:transcriptional regulator with XRE-family HTH domain
MTQESHPKIAPELRHHTRRIVVVEELGRRLRKARLRLQLSQEEVAARAGLGVQAYGSLERGWTPNGKPANPTLDTLIRVHTVLGLSLHEQDPKD